MLRHAIHRYANFKSDTMRVFGAHMMLAAGYSQLPGQSYLIHRFAKKSIGTIRLGGVM